MAYNKIHFNRTHYTPISGMHTRSSYADIRAAGGLEDLDVLVMEHASTSDQLLETAREQTTDRQYQETFRKIPLENPKLKIYNVDVVPFMTFGIWVMGEVMLNAAAFILCYNAVVNMITSRRTF